MSKKELFRVKTITGGRGKNLKLKLNDLKKKAKLKTWMDFIYISCVVYNNNKKNSKKIKNSIYTLLITYSVIIR